MAISKIQIELLHKLNHLHSLDYNSEATAAELGLSLNEYRHTLNALKGFGFAQIFDSLGVKGNGEEFERNVVPTEDGLKWGKNNLQNNQ